MILQRQIETEHSIIYVFRKDAVGISPVRAVAEAILKFGDDPAGMPSSAINFAIAGHPHSGGQRFREICQAYRRQWPGMAADASGVGLQFIESISADKNGGRYTHVSFPSSHVVLKNRFHFSPGFLSWLRASLPEIECVVYPIQSRRKFKD